MNELQGFRGLYRHVQRVVDSFRYIIDSFSEIYNCSEVGVDMFDFTVELSLSYPLDYSLDRSHQEVNKQFSKNKLFSTNLCIKQLGK